MSNTLQSIPGFNILSARSRAAIMSGDTPERAEAIARLVTGSGLMGLGGYLASIGLVTGRGPGDFGTRLQLESDTGWRPYSIRIGDAYLSYNRLDPIMIPFGLGATIAELTTNTEESDGIYDLLNKTANTAVVALGESVLSRSYLRGVAQVAALIYPRHQKEEEEAQNFVKRAGRMFAPSLIPGSAFVRTIEREVDPVLRETYGVLDSIYQHIPGLSSTLEPRRNLWADPIYNRGAIVRPVISELYSTDGKDPRATLIMAEAGFEVTKPSKKIGYPRLDKRVELTAKEYDALVIYSAGKELDFRPGTTGKLQLEIEDLADDSDWKKISIAQRHDLIQGVISKWRAIGRTRVKAQFPDIDKRAREALARQQGQTGVRNPLLRRQIRKQSTEDQLLQIESAGSGIGVTAR